MIGELKFKGTRDYLQGPDIFNAVEKSCAHAYGSGFLSRIEFRSFTDRQIRLTAGEIEENEIKIGTCCYACASGEAKNLDLVATSMPVLERYAYDEQWVVDASRIAAPEKTISSPKVEGVSVIEQIVALDKKLHYALCPNPPGRWVFTRLQCTRALPDIERECRIKVDRMLPNKFSESVIEIDGERVGTITFTVAP